MHKGLLTYHKNNPDDVGDVIAYVYGLSGVIAAITIVIMTITFPTENIKNCIKIKVAPKVYLVEEAIKLTK